MVGHLDRVYADLIDMSDVTAPPGPIRENVFRSRALTALAIRQQAGCSADEAANNVIDGFDDQGVDGVAVSADRRRVWIVQTKWSNQGTGGMDQGSALKFIRGIALLRDGDYEEFGDRLDGVRDVLDEALTNPNVQVSVVLCLFGKQHLAPVIRADFDKFLADVNHLHSMVDLVELYFDEVYEVVRRDAADPTVDLAVTLEQWGQLTEPYQAFYGCVPVSEVAAWYEASGEQLFNQNIRRSLGLTEVNQRIRTTLRTAPESFWYLNNGITVLCESLSKAFAGTNHAFGKFELTGASVVNGAQTVKSIYEVAREHPECADIARVWVRLITLDGCPPGFATQVTDATNTQNQVVARDFVSLDPVQTALRQEFALTLHKAYVIKRGEPDPDPDAGCSVVELANALACAYPDARFAARAQQGSVMWERGEQGTYDVLFSRPPSAERAWRLVGFLRAVEARLRAEESGRETRALRVVATAHFLITHALLRYAAEHAAEHGSADPDPTEWPNLLAEVGPLVDLLVITIDDLYTVHIAVPAVLGDADRCVELAAVALDHLRSGADAPQLPDRYRTVATHVRRPRRPNVVTVLVDATAIADGTRLRFVTRTAKEEAAFASWLADDPRRQEATWVNSRSKPLLWAADGGRYSPSGLVMDMVRSVGITVKALQGPRYWRLENGRSLIDVADEMRSAGTDL